MTNIDVNLLREFFLNSVIDICERAKNEDLDISFSIESDGRIQLDVKPFVPFTYACPNACNCKTERTEYEKAPSDIDDIIKQMGN